MEYLHKLDSVTEIKSLDGNRSYYPYFVFRLNRVCMGRNVTEFIEVVISIQLINM